MDKEVGMSKNIGFDKAAENLIQRFSNAWMEYHLPMTRRSSSKTNLN